MALPPGFLDEIRARVSLAQVVGRKVTWDRRKSNPAKGDYWAPCPFHQEKTPSFHVEDRKGFYYCFGCHAKGDAIGFLKDAENMSFIEAVEALAAEAGLPMPDRDPREEARQDRRAKLAEVMEQAAQFFRLQLKTARGQGARDYIERRGLRPETVERFEIGFAPDSRTALRDHLTGKGAELSQLDEAGLVIVPEDGGEPYDRFRGRLMFPIRDARGRCIAFGGRALNPEARAKYLNSPETTLFDKGRTLFNHGPAREAAGKAGALIVAEGYMDVIALAQAGFAHAVAPLGTAITEDQLRLIWRLADEPVIALDGDRAGLKAAMRVIDLALPLLEAGRSLRFALMPEGQDPDDVIRAAGPGAMRKLLDEALPMVELLWRRETAEGVFDSPERRAALDARLKAALARIADPGLRAHYVDALRERRARLFAPRRPQRPDLPGPAGRGQGRRWPPAGPAAPTPAVVSSLLARGPEGPAAAARGREATLLLVLVNHPALAQRRLDAVEDMEFVCPDLDDLRQRLISALSGSDGAAPKSSDLIAAMMRDDGENPIAALMATPFAREARFARAEADETVAELGFDEVYARHRALLSLAREVAEAEAELIAEPGEDVDRRLEAASGRGFTEGTPRMPDGEDDETHLSDRLKTVLEGIGGKRTGPRG